VARVDDPELLAIQVAARTWQQGDVSAAEQMIIGSFGRGGGRSLPMAMFELGRALEALGEDSGAQSCYLRAVMSGTGDLEAKGAASLTLAEFWLDRGQLGPAERLLAETAASAHPTFAPAARDRLARLHRPGGDP
jgi:hypothetical protein